MYEAGTFTEAMAAAGEWAVEYGDVYEVWERDREGRAAWVVARDSQGIVVQDRYPTAVYTVRVEP